VDNTEKIKELLGECNEPEQQVILKYLRQKYPIHPIEKELSTTAEIILESISRASDLTLRGIRGIIAEASFKLNVVNQLTGWEDITPSGDIPFDFLLFDGKNRIKIQVKMQRQKDHRPMMASEGYRFLSADKFVVETQKTRGGLDKKTNEDTRPYRFGEFDILAVSMHPSTNDWTVFLYTVADWLIPRPDNSDLLLKFQPVPIISNSDWTDNLLECFDWYYSKTDKKIER
jgi:hypothetical protein